jgi:hypothetical protein
VRSSMGSMRNSQSLTRSLHRKARVPLSMKHVCTAILFLAPMTFYTASTIAGDRQRSSPWRDSSDPAWSNTGMDFSTPTRFRGAFIWVRMGELYG